MRFGGPRLLEIDGWFRRSSIERWFGARLAPSASAAIALGTLATSGSGSDTATLSGDSAPAPTLVLTSSGSASDGLSLSARRALVLATSCSSWNDVELSGSSRIAGPPTIWSAQRKLDEVRRRQLAIDRANAAADTPLRAPPPPPPAVARPAGDHDSAASPLAPVPVVGAIDTARGALADEPAPSNEEAKSHTPTTEEPNADLPSAVRSSEPAAAPDAARLDRPQAVVVPQNIAIVAENIAPVAQNIAIVAPSPALLPDRAATSASATPDSVSSKQIADVPIVVVSPEIAASLGLSDDELVAVLLAITTPAPSRRLTRAPAASGV